jgi:hypothetical protein
LEGLGPSKIKNGRASCIIPGPSGLPGLKQGFSLVLTATFNGQGIMLYFEAETWAKLAEHCGNKEKRVYVDESGINQ